MFFINYIIFQLVSLLIPNFYKGIFKVISRYLLMVRWFGVGFLSYVSQYLFRYLFVYTYIFFKFCICLVHVFK